MAAAEEEPAADEVPAEETDETEGAESNRGCAHGSTPQEVKDIDGNNVIICITFNVHVIEKDHDEDHLY